MKKKTGKIEILPREPLTQKAKGAIEKYVALEGSKKGNFTFVLIRACLTAERMRRADLYALLEKRGLVWKQGYWQEAKNK